MSVSRAAQPKRRYAPPGSGIRGLIAASLTPLKDDLSCDVDLLAQHCRGLLAAGCDGLALFGTTGEGPSFGVRERMDALDRLLAAGVPAERLLVGGSVPALTDAGELARHAAANGCAGVFVMPPFYFKAVGEDGLVDWFARVIECAPDTRFYLYNLPELAGVSLGYGVVARLSERYPSTVVGLKDSSGDWPYTAGLLARFPDLDIFAGLETHVPGAMEKGAAGAISGLANVVPGLARGLCRGASEEPGSPLDRIRPLVEIVTRYPVVPALRAMQAHLSGDDRWTTPRPPLTPLPEAALRALAAALDQARAVNERVASP
ncbi:MAG: dihydrodipicolinate synthase family protein [Alphaproteobacteria bacterium]